MTEHKLQSITAARQALSTALAEQAISVRNDINEVAERILSDLYNAGAARGRALLVAYIPRARELSHVKRCKCGGVWPRHVAGCDIGEFLNATPSKP